MKVWKVLWIAILFIGACGESDVDSNDAELNDNSEEQNDSSSTDVQEPEILVETLKSRIDLEAMNQIGDFSGSYAFSTIDIYNGGEDVVERWSEKMWGRCCTEADLQFEETLWYKLSCNQQGEKYPFSNATDIAYNSAFVFKAEDAFN